MLYPVFGERAITGPIGLIADASCIIAIVAGTVGPIGFLRLQMPYGLNALFGIPDTFVTQTVVILALASVYTMSAIAGLSKGIQLLSKVNVILAFVLLAYMLLAEPSLSTVNGFVGGLGDYL